MNRLEMQSGRLFVVGALTMSLIVAVGVRSLHAVPLPAPTISHIAANDVDGDDKWENEIGATGTAYDWTMGSPQSPVTGIVAPNSSITAAYQYPAAIGTTGTYNAYNTVDSTFEMWFRPSNLTGEHVLHENGGTASTAITLDDNILRFGAREALADEMITAVTLSAAATSRFNHIVGVIQIGGDAGQIDLYLNGELVDTDSIGSDFALWTGSDVSGLGALNNSPLFAGDSFFGGTATDFDGQIAVFNFYNSALDAGQVTEAYQAYFVAPVPEPSTFLLLGLGLPALLRQRKRRSKA